jgi:hypothetical protein
MKLFELPDKGDYEEMAKKHNELVELVKSTSTSLGKMQEEFDQMPSGYRNAQDIKNLKGRIERLEEKHGVDGCFNKNTVGNLVEHRDRIEKLEECCKNTVASGKALEERVDWLRSNGKEMVKEALRSL